MKKFLYGLLGLVVVVAAALLVGPGLWDWNGYKPEIVARIKAETGRDMAIDGDLSLAVVPSPRLSVGGVRVANIEGATAPALARFESLRVRVRLMPLLSGRIEVESVELVEPVIELERLADGRVNWEPAAAGSGAADASRTAPGAAPRNGGGDDGSFALDRLVVHGGRLVYRDAAAGTVERIENLNVEASAGSLAGPFGLKGAMTLRGIPLDVAASVGRLADEGATPLEVRLAHAGTEATLSGGLDMAKTAFQGRIEASGSSLAALAESASGAAPGGASALPSWLAQPFSLRAELAASPENAALNEIDLRFADVSASGGIDAAMGERTRIDAALKINQIDLDKLLATAPAARSAAASGGGADPAATDAGSAAPSSGGGFALPAGIDGSIDISVESVGFKARRMSGIALSAALDNGALQLRRLDAGLPGGGAASLTGSLTARDGKASYKGKTSIRADNLRAILAWLEVDVDGIAADRLRKFTLEADLAGDADQVQVTDLAIRLDASRIDGGITYALRERPAFGARFSIDQLNADAYLPRSRAGTAATAEPDRPAAAPPGGASPGGGAPAPLAVLDTFDANIVLNVGTLSYQRTPIQGLVVDAGLVGGKLTVRRASVRNVSGATARIAGTLTGFQGLPVFSGDFSASSRDVTGLFRIAGIDTPFPPRRLGRFALSGKADAGAERVKLDTNLELAGATVTLAGELSALATAPRFDLDLRGRHPDGARLARLLGAENGAQNGSAGGVDLGVKAKGGLDAADLAVRLAVAGAEVTFAGKLSQPAAAPGLSGALEARHPDFVKLVRVFDPGYRPAKPVPGPLRLASKVSVSGTAARLEGLEGNIGPTAFTGTADVALAGPKPVVTAKLDAGDIDLNTLLPGGNDKGAPRSPAVVAAPAAPTEGGPGARRYSREPLDLSALGAYDGDVRVTAKSITWSTFRVDAPRLTATLKDGVATLGELSGKMFEGGFGLNGVLDARKVPKLDGAVKIEKANVGKALFEGRKYDITDGVLDFDMKVRAAGRSQADMVSTLDGVGKFAVRNGAVRGFDLKAVSDRLKNIDRALDFLSIFQSAMSGGTTRFSTLDGTLAIDKGVVRTADTRLVADAAEGTAKGFVDLARWNMDMQSEFRLVEHAKAPAFRVRLTGPPDQADTAIDYNDLQKFLVGRVVERGVGSLLRKVAPDLLPSQRAQPPAQASPAPQRQQPEQPQQQPEELKPKDFIRGLLKGLGR